MKKYDWFVIYIYFKNINWSVVIILNYKTSTQVSANGVFGILEQPTSLGWGCECWPGFQILVL